jgi:N-acetylmuramoyl-L-alanine amidase
LIILKYQDKGLGNLMGGGIMRKLKILIVQIKLIILCLSSFSTAQDIGQLVPAQELNRLNWVDVTKGRFSTQIMFDFAHPVFVKKKLVKEKLQLRLSFPGMQLAQFDAQQVIAKLSRLKVEGIVANVEVIEKNTKNIPKVIVAIDFAKNREITLGGKKEIRKNTLVIKWNKLDDPARLIFDIFTPETLEQLKEKEKVVLQAHNDSVKSDTDVAQGKQENKEREPAAPSYRIVLDAGHGGDDNGAKYFGLKEKELTLDITTRMRDLLREEGFIVLLTRQDDSDVSLAQRAELAQQLNANLFVSVHVNASPNDQERVQGIETFYLDPSEFLPPARQGGFIFVNIQTDVSLCKAIDSFLQETTNVSKKFALCVQKNILSVLQESGVKVNDRGIKRKFLRVLFLNQMPTVLVEVGFVSHKGEAKRLCNPEYQQLLAQGICKGVKEYIATI